MERIGDETRRQLGRFGPAAGMAAIVTAWPDSVGEEIAKNAWPARLGRDGTLHISVSSAAWGFELTHLEGAILERLRAALGKKAPSRLRFAPGPLPERAPESVKEVKNVAPQPTAGERSEGARIAAGIGDEELRKLVARAAAASLAGASDGRSVW
jgi:hypothetical protein